MPSKKSHHERMVEDGWEPFMGPRDDQRYRKTVGKLEIEIWRAPARGMGYVWRATRAGAVIVGDGEGRSLRSAATSADAYAQRQHDPAPLRADRSFAREFAARVR